MFTALVADLMLVPAGDQTTALSLTGAFWPPPGRATAGLETVIALLCHDGDRQLPGLGGLRARPSSGHSRASRLLPGPWPRKRAITGIRVQPGGEAEDQVLEGAEPAGEAAGVFAVAVRR